MKKISDLKIMDWLIHGGHQYEFFKTGPSFFCTKLNGQPPTDEDFSRPALNNELVRMTADKELNLLKRRDFDIIMVRLGLNPRRRDPFMRRKKIPGIAVIQTSTGTFPNKSFPIPGWVKVVVWNSKSAMNKSYRNLPGKKHFYIPHGFDQNEFCNLGLDRNGRILTVANVFQKRGKILGFDNWRYVSKATGLCDLVGHGDESLPESIGCFSMQKLVKTYNSYSVFLNTTVHSAMPRSRGEALMCGTPIVTTKNNGIDLYLKHNESCLFADNKFDMERSVKRVLSDDQLAESLSHYGRESAIRHFSITQYIERWKEAFEAALR